MSAALGAAVAASACCTIPLALVSLGIGGAWVGSLTALAPYRWIFVDLAVGALGYAAYSERRAHDENAVSQSQFGRRLSCHSLYPA